MNKTRLLLVVFLLAFIITLVLTVPVRLLWHHGGQHLGLPVEMSHLSGNLWQGQGELRHAGQSMQLGWRLAPAALRTAHLGYDLSVQAPGVDLSGRAEYRPGSYRLAGLDGFAAMAQANPWLQQAGTELDGRLWLDDLHLRWRPRSGRVSGEGRFDWRQGRVDFNWLDGQRRSVDLPLLAGTLTTNGNGVTQAQVSDGDHPVVRVELDADGDLMYRLYTHLREVLQVEMPGGQEVIMEGQVNVRETLQW